jgi:hypothetical protein
MIAQGPFLMIVYSWMAPGSRLTRRAPSATRAKENRTSQERECKRERAYPVFAFHEFCPLDGFRCSGLRGDSLGVIDWTRVPVRDDEMR